MHIFALHISALYVSLVCIQRPQGSRRNVFSFCACNTVASHKRLTEAINPSQNCVPTASTRTFDMRRNFSKVPAPHFSNMNQSCLTYQRHGKDDGNEFGCLHANGHLEQLRHLLFYHHMTSITALFPRSALLPTCCIHRGLSPRSVLLAASLQLFAVFYPEVLCML